MMKMKLTDVFGTKPKKHKNQQKSRWF